MPVLNYRSRVHRPAPINKNEVHEKRLGARGPARGRGSNHLARLQRACDRRKAESKKVDEGMSVSAHTRGSAAGPRGEPQRGGHTRPCAQHAEPVPSPGHHVTMSPRHQVTMSPCHPRSPCHHVAMSPRHPGHHVTMSPRHPTSPCRHVTM